MIKRLLLICLVSNNLYAACGSSNNTTYCPDSGISNYYCPDSGPCATKNPCGTPLCDSAAKHYPGVTPPNYMGNSRTGSFDCAITGTTDELTATKLAERAKLLPVSLDNRFYVRLGGNIAAEGVASVKNTGEQSTTASALVLNDENKIASNSYELAVGYVWKQFALDLEWLGMQSVPYNSTLTNITPELNYTTTLNGDAILLNIYWIFKDLYNIKLYGLACGGMAFNKTESTLGNGTVSAFDRDSIAYGIGFGGRFNIISKIYADMAARYIILGTVKYEASTANNSASMLLKGTRGWFGMSFRLLWMI